MKGGVYMFHHAETGVFSDKVLMTTNRSVVEANTPRGHVAIEGFFDHLSQRIDIERNQIVDYQPPSPSVDHEWDATSKRWALSVAAKEREEVRANASVRIRMLEEAQHRPMRELALDPSNAEARKKLDAIESEIASLRGAL